jgi:hypothetical protein
MLGYVLPALIYIKANEEEFHYACTVTFGRSFKSYSITGRDQQEVSNQPNSIYEMKNAVINNPDNTKSIGAQDHTLKYASQIIESNSDSDEEVIEFSHPLDITNDLNREIIHDNKEDKEEKDDSGSSKRSSREVYSLLGENRTSFISASLMSTIRNRLEAFSKFYLPVGMILFGIVAGISGVGTVIYQQVNK